MEDSMEYIESMRDLYKKCNDKKYNEELVQELLEAGIKEENESPSGKAFLNDSLIGYEPWHIGYEPWHIGMVRPTVEDVVDQTSLHYRIIHGTLWISEAAIELTPEYMGE